MDPVSRLRRFVETRIDPFADEHAIAEPEQGLAAFCWRASAPARPFLALMTLLSILAGAAEAYVIVLVGRFVDLLATADPADALAAHAPALVGMAAFVMLAKPALQLVRTMVASQMVTPQFTASVQWRAYRYALGHSVEYFQSDLAGRVSQRILQAGGAIRSIVMTSLDGLVTVGVFAVSTAVVFAALAPAMIAPVAAWAVAYGLLVRFVVPRAMALSTERSAARSNLSAQVVDTVANVATLKLFAQGGHERDRVRAALERSLSSALANAWLTARAGGALSFLNGLLFVAIGAIALARWSEGALTAGAAAAALALALRLATISGAVMGQAQGLLESLGTLREAMRTIARRHTVTDAPDAAPFAPGGGEIRFEAVRFGYGREDGAVLDGFSLHVRPGEKVGLVGASGAGKSTVVSLLLRLHDLEGGRILVDGQDVSRVAQDGLRAGIGVVTQDTSLLHRSIRDNVAYGRRGASDAEIERAARLAHAHDFVADLVDQAGRRGYDAHVGERGVRLSGGQRQRIAIARVILKDAPILVLDEATSALDSGTEAAIQDSLSRLMEGRTVIAIAHRLSTIAALDRLVVMHEGRIVEEGTHEALLARGGAYARLWAMQSGGFIGAGGAGGAGGAERAAG